MAENGRMIKLDGSYGAGPNAELTIFTREENGREKEEIFTIPFMILNMEVLNVLNQMHLILGYKIIKVDKPSALKELGL